MKTPLIIIAVLVTSFTTGLGQPAVPTGVSSQGYSQPAPLPANYQLQLKGTSDKETFLDISVTGIGPTFNIQTAEDPFASFQGTITRRDDKFVVAYTISQQFEIATSKNSYESKQSSLNGSVELVLGKPSTIAKINGKKYTLEISQSE